MACILKRQGKKGTKYYIVYRLNGRQKWKSVGNTYAVAKLKLKEFEYKLETRDFEDWLKRDKPIPFSRFVNERYLPWMETRRERNTYLSAIYSCKHLIKFFKETPLSRLDNKMIEEYIKQRKNKVKPRTVNIELTCLGHIFKRAIEEKYYFKENPFNRIEKLKVPRKNPRFLSPEEMQKLWKNATPWTRIFIVVASHSGMRAGEVSNLRWYDIQWNRNIIQVKLTKTNREREIPMDTILRKTLLWFKENYIDFRRMIVIPRTPAQMEYVFCDINGKKIYKFHKAFNRAKEKAGLKNITVHTLRHTYASHLANKGIPLLTIRELLGHTDIKTTTIYSHLANGHLQNAVKQIDYGLDISSLN